MDDELKLAGVWNDEIDERIKACDLFMPPRLTPLRL
jgi:hypothetical protein